MRQTLFLALNVLCGVCTGGCHPLKFWPMIKTAGSLSPVRSGEAKALARTARWAGSATAAGRTKPCVQLCLGVSCRRYSEAP